MSTAAVDYAALAKQAGAISSTPAGGAVDYAALAKQAGAIQSTPASEEAPTYAGPPPFEAEGMSGFSQIGPQEPGERAAAVATGVGLGATAAYGGAFQAPIRGALSTLYHSHPVAGPLIASYAISKLREVPEIGKFVPPAAELIPWLLGGKGTAGKAAAGEAAAGEAAEAAPVAAEPAPAPLSPRAQAGQLANEAIRSAGDNPEASSMPAPGQPIARRPGQPINVAPGPASAEMTPVKSSAVDSYHYDPQAQVLTVRTQSGGYRYAEVTPEEFSAFVRADSKGRAYNVIKNNHTQISYDKGFGWRFSHPTIPKGEEGTIRTMSLGICWEEETRNHETE